MCANFKPMSKRLSPQLNLLAACFDYADDIYPGHDCPLLFAKSAQDEIEWRSVKFGMLPKWAKDIEICRSTYNARTETVHEKPSFKNAWAKSQFALIPVEAIYEPRYINAKAQRWRISRQDQQPFTIAAIYENSILNGEQVRSMSMLTINADQHPFMSQFHHPKDEKRSIIVIPEASRRDWLHCQPHEAADFFQAMPDEFMAEYCPRPQSILQNSLDL